MSPVAERNTKERLVEEADRIAPERDRWKQRNRTYHQEIKSLCAFVVAPGQNVLELGCSTGDLLASVQPRRGVGIDISPASIALARAKHPSIDWQVGDAEDLALDESFDVVIISDLIGYLSDLWQAFRNLRHVTAPETRILVTYYNALWEPLLWLAEKLKLKTPQHLQNWLSLDDIENQLNLNGYEVIRKGHRLLIPFYIPLLSRWINRYLTQLPFLAELCLIQFVIARERATPGEARALSCSVIVPCRNEAGNIETAIQTIPLMGSRTEVFFVDGNSTDGTYELIQKQIETYHGPLTLRLMSQGDGRGKGDAVRRGFEQATGDVLFILDADLTVPPADLPKFYMAIAENEGEFINGTRLVYPMEDESMRFLNLLGNKLFSLIFTWLLDQKIKDTLCGTKVISKHNYDRLAAGRVFFGDFDPFGDFDLLFGAAKLNLKIVEIPVRYRARVYGDTKIDRFAHGWLLLRMCGVAMRRLKFR